MQKIHYINQDESILISYEKQTPPHDMTVNHFHDSYEIYYLLSGERYYFIKDRTYHIVKGSLVFINTYELHRTLDAHVPSWERILINFKPGFLISDDTDRIGRLVSLFSTGSNILRFPVKEQTMIEELLFKLLSETDNSNTCFEEMLAAYLIQLLVFSSRFIGQNTISVNSSNHYIHKKAAPIVQYINSHYMEPLSLNSLAELFYMSPYYLCKVFKESTGFSFVEYLNQIRIKEAQILLSSLDSSIIEISQKVGFGSVSQFGRVFKDISGVSPLKYRKKTQQIKTITKYT
jgi:AraC-like DNA-binding protein